MLIWTTKPPKEPGWYWLYTFGAIEIVKIVYSGYHNELWLEKIGTGIHQQYDKFLEQQIPHKWAGPIPEPEGDEEWIRLKSKS